MRKNRIIEKIEEALGGKWQVTPPDALVQGYMASFKQFQANAVIGVINAMAEQAGAHEHAIFIGGSALGGDPATLRTVIIPNALASNRHFQQQLTADMRQAIAGIISQQLAHAAMLGLHGR